MENNLNLYYIFYCVAKSKSISKASEQLYISQPAVSKAISKLERNLSVKLFSRTSKGVLLTPDGEQLFDHVETAMLSLHYGEEQILTRNSIECGYFTIGVSTTLCKYVLLPYLKEFRKDHPNIRIRIECQSSAHTLDYLNQGKIDIGLVSEPDKSKNYHFYPLKEIKDIFVSTNEYLRHQKLVGADLLNKATLILLDKENLTRQYVDSFLSPFQIEESNTIEVTTMDLLIEFAKTDLGISCVIEDFVKEELASQQLVKVPSFPEIPTRKIGFVCSSQPNPNKILKAFMEFIHSANISKY